MKTIIIAAAALAVAWICGCNGGGKDDKDADAQSDVSVEDAGPDVEEDVSDEDVAADTGEDPETPDADDDPADDAESGDIIEVELGPVVASCPTHDFELRDGLNMGFVSNEVERTFLLMLPDGYDEEEGPWPVVFTWHSLNHDCEEGADIIRDYVDTPGFAFIGVAPSSLKMELPDGFEWDVLTYDEGDNFDVELFDDLLACLDEAFGVDEDRVHSVGWSGGAIMCDLLSIARGDELASTVAFSGTYFSDERQVVIPGAMYWPEYGLTNKFTTVVVWGGEEDVYMPFLSFNSAALNTIDYLNTLGHDVIGCNHGGAHSLPPDFTGEQVVEFFKDHPMGSHPTPYAGDGLPEDFPGYCELHAAE